MAIVALKKLTVCGLISEKVRMLETLQTLGCAHLIELREPSEKHDRTESGFAEKALRALNYLNQCPAKRHSCDDHRAFDPEKVVETVLKVESESRQLAETRAALSRRIQEIEPWGDFSLPGENELNGLQLWFYRVPARLAEAMRKVDRVWQQVGEDAGFRYIVVIDREEPPPSSMPVPRTPVGKVPLSGLRQEIDRLDLALEDLEAERESLTRRIGPIAAAVARAEDLSGLKYAESVAIETDGVFIAQAWIPENRLADIGRVFRRNRWALQWADPAVGDNPPTLLSNPEALAGGEELIRFYHPPPYAGWDPSIVVFFSFAAFFSMILSDAGYAFLFALLLGVYWRKLGSTRKRLRLRRLASVTVLFSLAWGALAGSYFGVAPAPSSPLGAIHIIHFSDFDAMMRLSIAVGAAHIAFANGVMFYQRLGRSIAWVYLGWGFVVLGGFFLWYAMSQQNALWQWPAGGVIAVGGLLLMLFSSERPVTKPIDWLWRFLDGCKSLTRMSGLFGDVLSYLRLFALGLSSASLALIFNQLAGQVYRSLEGVGAAGAVLILLLGHALNLMLCLMSGIVHGLRLNFIEFYRWGVADEGHPFKAFAKKEFLND
jgi:V/A-type H+-transporting ATPase subunit I